MSEMTPNTQGRYKFSAIVLAVVSMACLALIWEILLSTGGEKTFQVLLAPFAAAAFVGLFLAGCLAMYVALTDS